MPRWPSWAGGPSGRRPQDALARLRGDPALHFTTRDEFFDDGRGRCLARADGGRPRLVRPPAAARVRGVRDGPARGEALDHRLLPPAGDGRLAAGQYYINTDAPETRPRYEAEALAFHESVPGHHPQIALGQELPACPSSAGTWADGVLRGLGAVHRAAVRRDGPVHAATSTGSASSRSTPGGPAAWSSTPGSTRWAGPASRRSTFMLEHTALAPNNIDNEVDRYIGLPGQALAYKLGQLEILRLRDEARGAAGRRVRHPRLPRRGARPAARSPSRRCAASSRPGPRGGSPRADGRQRGRRPGQAARDRHPVPASGSCATATSGSLELLVDARRGRRLGPARGRAAGRLRRGRCRCWSGSCR